MLGFTKKVPAEMCHSQQTQLQEDSERLRALLADKAEHQPLAKSISTPRLLSHRCLRRSLHEMKDLAESLSIHIIQRMSSKLIVA